MLKNYFKHRNIKRKETKTQILAEREICNLIDRVQKSTKFPFNKGTKVVDLGCGDMFLAEPIVSRGFSYNGYDIDTLNLLTDRIPLESNSTDVVLCYSVIEHLSDPSNLLAEAHRVLKDDGVFIVETPNWQFSKNDFFDDYTHVKPYSIKSLKSILNDFGFMCVEISPNIRCKPDFFYNNILGFYLARWLPFKGFGGPLSFLKGRSRGLFFIAQKK